MSNQIFSDSDHNFQMTRTVDGVLVQVVCPFCENRFTVKHDWNEVKLMLQGYAVPGVTNTTEGWKMESECPPPSGCSQMVRYGISQDELERVADQHLAAMQRMANARR
jgi:hypothetical protein